MTTTPSHEARMRSLPHRLNPSVVLIPSEVQRDFEGVVLIEPPALIMVDFSSQTSHGLLLLYKPFLCGMKSSAYFRQLGVLIGEVVTPFEQPRLEALLPLLETADASLELFDGGRRLFLQEPLLVLEMLCVIVSSDIALADVVSSRRCFQNQ